MQTVRPLQKFLAANSSDADFTAPADTIKNHAVPPTATAVSLGVAPGSGVCPCGIVLYPYGLGDDDAAFSVRVIGWSRVGPPTADGRVHWAPTIIAVLGAVISTDVGVAGGTVIETERYADAITVSAEGTLTADVTRTGSIVVTAPGANLRAHCRVPLEGFEYVDLKFDQTTGTPTMNCLYRLIDNVY